MLGPPKRAASVLLVAPAFFTEGVVAFGWVVCIEDSSVTACNNEVGVCCVSPRLLNPLDCNGVVSCSALVVSLGEALVDDSPSDDFASKDSIFGVLRSKSSFNWSFGVVGGRSIE